MVLELFLPGSDQLKCWVLAILAVSQAVVLTLPLGEFQTIA